MDNISVILKKIQADTSMSQVALAQRLHVSQPTVYRILCGQVDCKASTFRAIMELHASLESGADTAVPDQALDRHSQN